MCLCALEGALIASLAKVQHACTRACMNIEFTSKRWLDLGGPALPGGRRGRVGQGGYSRGRRHPPSPYRIVQGVVPCCTTEAAAASVRVGTGVDGPGCRRQCRPYVRAGRQAGVRERSSSSGAPAGAALNPLQHAAQPLPLRSIKAMWRPHAPQLPTRLQPHKPSPAHPLLTLPQPQGSARSLVRCMRLPPARSREPGRATPAALTRSVRQ